MPQRAHCPGQSSPLVEIERNGEASSLLAEGGGAEHLQLPLLFQGEHWLVVGILGCLPPALHLLVTWPLGIGPG
jgi:hypothetical protein